jgi:hypothetical protein
VPLLREELALHGRIVVADNGPVSGSGIEGSPEE